jgi:DNA-binding NarL/FixJ family response regulator
MSYSLLLIDSQKIMIEGIQMLLGSHAEIASVNGVRTHAECLAWLESTEVLPDVLLLDLLLPDIHGLEALKELVELYPNIKVIMLTSNDDMQVIKDALSFGAKGYMLKNVGKDELVNAVRAVANNYRYLDTELHERLIDNLLNGTISTPGAPADATNIKKLGLTSREMEVLSLIVEGKTNNDIAQELYISPNTVDTHRKNIMAKCDVHNVAELTKFAFKYGLATH